MQSVGYFACLALPLEFCSHPLWGRLAITTTDACWMMKYQKGRGQGRRWPSVSLNGVPDSNLDVPAVGWVEVQDERGLYELLFPSLWPNTLKEATPGRKALFELTLWGCSPSLRGRHSDGRSSQLWWQERGAACSHLSGSASGTGIKTSKVGPSPETRFLM